MSSDPRIDLYISKAAPFAQPILKRLRSAVHKGCPDVKETMKWSAPAFDYKGVFCSMAAFKRHAMFGFWKHQLMKEMLPKGEQRAFGAFAKITSVDAMPSEAAIVRIVKAAKRLNDEGVKVAREKKPPKPPVRVPPYFQAMLRKSPKAAEVFKAFSPSHRREYVEWITEAKSDATRERRVAQAIEWILEGKSRNWKYERPTDQRTARRTLDGPWTDLGPKDGRGTRDPGLQCLHAHEAMCLDRRRRAGRGMHQHRVRA